MLSPAPALADSGGVSFWLPGAFASLAATPTVPGWAYSTIYLHLQANAGATQNFVTSNGARGSVVTGLSAHGDALVQGITYTSPLSVLGGQAAFTVLAAPGNLGASIDATLTGPRGNAISGVATDNRTTVSDVLYQGTLKWNQGVHNEMVYIVGNIPSGTYQPAGQSELRLSGGRRWGGLYLSRPEDWPRILGRRRSDLQRDQPVPPVPERHRLPCRLGGFAVRHKTVHIGLVGYYFQQLTDDSGLGAKLGGFRGMAVGLGPEIGFIIPLSKDYQGYLNLGDTRIWRPKTARTPGAHG
jgi:hypothetical protein